MALPWQRDWGAPQPALPAAAGRPWERGWAAPLALVPPAEADTVLEPERRPLAAEAVDEMARDDPMRLAQLVSAPGNGPGVAQADPVEADGDLLARRGQQFMAGVGEAVAGVPESAAIVGRRIAEGRRDSSAGAAAGYEAEIQKLQAALDSGTIDGEPIGERHRQVLQAEITRLGNFRDMGRNLAEQTTAEGVDRPLSETPGFKAGDAVRGAVEDRFGKPDPADSSFWGQVAQGLGNVTGMAAVAVPTLGAGGFASGIGMSGRGLYDEAIAAGADEETARRAAEIGGLIGSTEMLPLLRSYKLLPASVRGQVTNRFLRGVLKVAEGSGEEAAQEAVSQAAQNLVAQKLYDPDRGWNEGIGTAALVGGVIGAGPAAIGGAREIAAPAAQQPQRLPRASASPETPAAASIAPVAAPGRLGQAPRPDLPVTAEQLASPIQTPLLQEGEEIIRRAVAGEAPALPKGEAPPPLDAPVADALPKPWQRDWGMLSAAGYSDEDIAGMSPAEREAEVEQARMQGVEPSQAQPPVPPTQEPQEAPAATGTAAQPSARPEPAPRVSGPAVPEPSGTVMLGPDDIDADAARFQFKSGGGREGVTNALPEGQSPKLRTIVLREADGVSAEQARVYGAMKNLAEGGESTNAIDVARVFRGGGTPDAVSAQIPPNRRAFRDGQALARLGDDAWGMAINEAVEAPVAAEVGREISDPAQQVAALGYLAKAAPRNLDEARLIVGEIKAAGFSEGTQDGLFGPEALAETLIAERARILDNAGKFLRLRGRVFKTAIDSSEVLAEAGNVLDADANIANMTENQRLAVALERLAQRKGPISDALTDQARRLKAGEATPGEARIAFLATLRRDQPGVADAARGARAKGGGVARPDPSPDPAAEAPAPRLDVKAAKTRGDSRTGDIFSVAPTRAAEKESPREAGSIDLTSQGEQRGIPGAEKVTPEAARAAARRQRDQAEIAAQQQQSKIRRLDQERVEDGDGGLFGGKQGALFAKGRAGPAANLAVRIDDVLAGRRRLEPVVVGPAPEVLVALGAAADPVIITPGVIDKAISKHRMTADEVKAALRGIYDPVMVFDSAPESDAPADSYVVAVEGTSQGRPVVVAVHLNRSVGKMKISNIASVHRKDAPRSVLRWIEDGLTRYEGKRAGRWLGLLGLQLPRAVVQHRQGKKVLYHADVFKDQGVKTRRAVGNYAIETSAEFDAAVPEIVADIKRQLADMSLPGLKVGVAERLFARDPEAGEFYEIDGLFSPSGLIAIATGGSRDRNAAIGHEALHALRDAGLFRDAEWLALERAALADTARMDRARAEYPELDEAGHIEEAVADLYGEWRAGRFEAKGFLRTAFDRIRGLIEALGISMRGNGFRTAESVFRALDRGEIGRRRPEASGVKAGRAGKPSEAKLAKTRGVIAKGGSTQTVIDLPAETDRQFAWRKIKDDKARLIQAQREIERLSGSPLPEHLDGYLVAGLFQTKLANSLKKYQEGPVKALLRQVRAAMKATGADVANLEDYLIAMHAPARNKLMAERNPDLGPIGSGVSDADAAKVVSEAKAKGWDAQFEPVAQAVYDLLKADVRRRVAAGLISQDQADAWAAMYPDGRYVPLRGFAERADDDPTPQAGAMRTGRGFDVRGQESRRAEGRKSSADSPIAYAIMMGSEGIIRSEKNAVAKTVYRFAKEHPTSAAKAIGRLPVRTQTDLSTGSPALVVDNAALQAPNIMAAKIGGKPYYIELSPELAVGFKNLGVEQLNGISRVARKLTRYWSSMLTSRNPAFFIPNATVDFMTGILTAMQADAPKGFTRAYLRGYIGAMTTLWQANAGIPLSADQRKMFDEWEADGGRMNFYGYETLEDLKANLKSNARRGTKGTARRVAGATIPRTFAAVEWLNYPFENAARFASYIAARKLGVSRAKAAMHSLESTGNFARRGEWTPLIGAWFPFFNASMTGIEQLGRYARKRSTQSVLAGAVMFPAIWAIAAATAYPGDDDPEQLPLYFRIPDWERQRSVIIPRGVVEEEITNPDGSKRLVKRLNYLSIRIPHALRPFWTFGDQIAQLWLGGIGSVGGAFSNVIESVLFNWNPISGQDPVAMALPLALDPVYELSQNEDGLGRTIRPGGFDDEPLGVPAYSWKTGQTAPAFIAASRMLNAATGGDSVTPGALSVHPDHLEYLWEFVTGGLGRFAAETTQLGANLLEGIQTAPNRIPILRTVKGRTTEGEQTGRFYDMLGEGEALAARMNNIKKRVVTGQLGDDEWQEALALADQLGAVLSRDKDTDWDKSWVRVLRKARNETNRIRDEEITPAMSRSDIDRAAIEGLVAGMRGRQEAARLAARTQALEMRALRPTP